MDSDVVVVGAGRTPIGSFGGSLRDVPVYDLGAAAISGVLERSGIAPNLIEKVIYGNCRQAGNGPNPARTAAVKAGIPVTAPAMTVNMACPSGMKSVMLAGQELQAGRAGVVLAGGMESMSTMPYLLKGARWDGFKLGDKILHDGWSDAVDPLCGLGMGMTAENLARKYGIGRQEQDEFSLLSQQRAAAAQAAGLFGDEILPLHLPLNKAAPDGLTFAADECPRRGTTPEKLAQLRPAFQKGGTVTAGNACAMGDAACAIVLTTRSHAKDLGLSPLFSIVSSAETAVAPELMGDGPAASIPIAIADADMALSDIDFIEVNEAFAVQVLANERCLKWERDRVNVWGGAIALGHPTATSGARLLMTLNSILRHHDKEIGIAAICGGGGVSTAMVIRRES